MSLALITNASYPRALCATMMNAFDYRLFIRFAYIATMFRFAFAKSVLSNMLSVHPPKLLSPYVDQ